MENDELQVFEEAGVTYAIPTVQQGVPMRSPGWRVFSYQWKHVPTGMGGVSFVLCMNGREAHRLIEHWNRTSEWDYSLA